MSGSLRALVSAGFAEGHAYPALALARALRDRGHEVSVGLSKRWQAAIEELGLGFVRVEEYVHFPQLAPGRPRSVVDAARELEATIQESRPDVVVADVGSPAPALAAELAEVPNATLIPTLYPVQGPGLPPYLLGLRPPRTALGARAWRIAEPPLRPLRHSTRWLRRVPALVAETRRKLGLPPLPPGHGPWTTYGTISDGLALVATFPQLEYARTWPPQVQVTGPMLFELPHPAIELPPGEDPLVLVAPSTVHETARELISASLRALESEPVRVVATLNRHGAQWDEPVPRNAIVVDWLSYAQLMPRSALVIATGGHGTVVRALGDGLPMLVCPAGADTAENGARVRWAGVGSTLPRWRLTPTAVRRAVRELLDDPGPVSRARDLASWSRSHDGALRGAELVERYALDAGNARAAQPR